MPGRNRMALNPGLWVRKRQGNCFLAIPCKKTKCLEEHSPAQKCPGKPHTLSARYHSVWKNKTRAILETSQNILNILFLK